QRVDDGAPRGPEHDVVDADGLRDAERAEDREHHRHRNACQPPEHAGLKAPLREGSRPPALGDRRDHLNAAASASRIAWAVAASTAVRARPPRTGGSSSWSASGTGAPSMIRYSIDQVRRTASRS